MTDMAAKFLQTVQTILQDDLRTCRGEKLSSHRTGFCLNAGMRRTPRVKTIVMCDFSMKISTTILDYTTIPNNAHACMAYACTCTPFLLVLISSRGSFKYSAFNTPLVLPERNFRRLISNSNVSRVMTKLL